MESKSLSSQQAPGVSQLLSRDDADPKDFTLKHASSRFLHYHELPVPNRPTADYYKALCAPGGILRLFLWP